MECWRKGNYSIIADYVTSAQEVEGGISAKLECGETVFFKDTGSVYSNYNRFQGLMDVVKKDRFAALIYEKNNTKTVVAFAVWYGIITHKELVDDNGNALCFLLGKLTKNMPQNNVSTDKDGNRVLSTKVSVFYKKSGTGGFADVVFYGENVVSVNAVYENTEAYVLGKIISPRDSSDLKLEGVCLGMI